MTYKFMRRAEVQAATGLPTSSLYALIQRGEFPKPIHITERSVGWLASDVEAWQQARLAAAKHHQAA